MKYDTIQSSSDILDNFFSGLLKGKMEELTSLDRGWQKVLCELDVGCKRIEGETKDGEKLAIHSSVKEIKNGIIFVETDHPAWIQLFNFHKKRILSCFKKDFPQITVKDMNFTVKND